MVEVDQFEVSTGRFGLVQEGLPAGLARLLGPYLARQRWYAGSGVPGELRVLEGGTLVELPAQARLLWAVVVANDHRYQLLLAERPAEDATRRVAGHEAATLGSVEGRAYYDATVDAEMALALLEAASGGTYKAKVARPLGAEQSNTSVVYDDKMVLKIFRRLAGGPNLDAEVTSALARAGFAHVARPVLRWRKGGTDLAFGQEYLAGGTDGWALALTSLRDLYTPEPLRGDGYKDQDRSDPEMRGGDFAAEAERLGRVTAEMHLCMAGAFGTSRDWSTSWSSLLGSLEADLRHIGEDMVGAARSLLQRLRSLSDLGVALRPHGDYHLGQVMRTDAGWYVLDFEGEPNRPVEERLRPTSPMKDVACMLRSFDYATSYATRFQMVQAEMAGAGAQLPELAARGEVGPRASALEPLAQAWKERNGDAFMKGYQSCSGIEELLPADPADRETLRMGYELEKALYELSYERAFRPEWAEIPLHALRRLFGGP